MLRTKVLTMCGVAMMLAACGTSQPVTVSAACRAVGHELAGAKGLTRTDQEKIDITEERFVRAGCWTRAQARG